MVRVPEFFATLLHAATAAHMLHLRTSSFAAHMALDELYKGLPELTDELIEAYQGCYSVVHDYPSGFTPPGAPDEPEEFVGRLKDYVKDNRACVGPETQLQNMVDEVAGLLDGVLYKLKNLG